MNLTNFTYDTEHTITIPSGDIKLDGLLYVPKGATGLVLFVHGSGSSRFSTRNQHVAHVLNDAKLATLLFDLLTPDEDLVDSHTREFRFDIGLLSARLIDTTRWCLKQDAINHLPIGYFGASTGGAAALVAAAKESKHVYAVVSRGGRPDLAGDALDDVRSPTLLIVGGNDDVVIQLNQTAGLKMRGCIKKLDIIPGATHLFEEHGALDKVARLAKIWFLKYLTRS